MSTEDNKTLMRRFFEEVYTEKNLDAIEEFICSRHCCTREQRWCLFSLG